MTSRGASRRALLLAVTLVAWCPAAAALAQEDPPAGDARRTLARLPANLVLGAFSVFSPDNLVPLLIGAAASEGSGLFDEAVGERVGDPDNAFGRAFEAGSEPSWSGAAVGVAFAAGRIARNTPFRAASYDWLDAYLVNYGYTVLVKKVVGRERPNRADTKSFPSGHASNAFALAAVASRHYGPKVAVPAYALAAAVAFSRVQRNAHYLSDVAAGATLGYIVGRTVVRANGRPLPGDRGARLDISPALGRTTRALVVRLSF